MHGASRSRDAGWMRSALCCMKMAQDRLEECLQAVVTGTHPRTIER
jgi:hypothetical protein